MRIFMILLAGVLLQACATITTGTTSTISVVTDPPGASCSMKRSDALIAVVNPTPGVATVSKSTLPIAVECTHPQAQTAHSSLQAQFQAMTLGNILLGGVIGVAVDAASGAMGNYPPNITIALVPHRFTSAPTRDAAIQARLEETRTVFAERIAAVRRRCAAGARTACTGHVAQLEAERDAALQQIELGRAATRVGEG